ncbi:RluA family pseudouridine synthase [Candidatus Uhrbacteria bacterium]|nr:RluA family pseudouridine synthase [Candidatus Uhrbacteria bacterium]
MDILYEDNHLIAVRKPHGMLTQGDETGDVNVMDEVKALLKSRDAKPGNVFLGLLHRLDRPVGGVVLFAKTSKGASRLSEQFRSHSIDKTYWAVVEGRPEKTAGDVIQWLVKDEAKNFVTAYDHEVPDSQRAQLSYRVLASKDGRSLVEVQPATGRPHQIRVAMASLGTPIVGDKKYGASHPLQLPLGQGEGHSGAIGLFARSLEFDQPVTKERITVAAEPELDIFRTVG